MCRQRSNNNNNRIRMTMRTLISLFFLVATVAGQITHPFGCTSVPGTGGCSRSFSAPFGVEMSMNALPPNPGLAVGAPAGFFVTGIPEPGVPRTVFVFLGSQLGGTSIPLLRCSFELQLFTLVRTATDPGNPWVVMPWLTVPNNPNLRGIQVFFQTIITYQGLSAADASQAIVCRVL